MQHLAGVIGLTLLILFAVVEPSSCETNDPEGRARTFFARFVEISHAFDPAVADFYADEARIVSVRKYPGGAERTLEMQGVEYKSLLRSVMPLAKARGRLVHTIDCRDDLRSEPLFLFTHAGHPAQECSNEACERVSAHSCKL